MAIRGGRPNDRRISAHLLVRDVNSAIEFYGRALGAEALYGSALPDGRIMHAHLKIADSVVMLTREDLGSEKEGASPHDAGMPTRSPESLGGTSVIVELYVDDVDAAFKRAIDAGAEPKCPVTDCFYGDRYGQFTDPFGHVWAVATVKEVLTADEVNARAMALFG